MKSYTVCFPLHLLTFLFFCSIRLSAQRGHETTAQQSQPEIFGEGVISTGDYETHPAFSPGGDTLYFLKCLADANFCSICVSYHKNGKWSTPVMAPFSGQYADADPFVTKHGNTIYFVSNRPLVEGGKPKEDWDIWKVDRVGKGWGKPVPLGAAINSTGSEFFPTLADNGDLYFGSSREGGKGWTDIYMARWTKDG